MKKKLLKVLNIATLLATILTIILVILAFTLTGEKRNYKINLEAFNAIAKYQETLMRSGLINQKFNEDSIIEAKIDNLIADTTKYAVVYKEQAKLSGIHEKKGQYYLNLEDITIDSVLLDTIQFYKDKPMTYSEIDALFSINKARFLMIHFDDKNSDSILYTEINSKSSFLEYWKWAVVSFVFTILLLPIRFFLTEKEFTQTSEAISKLLETGDTSSDKIKPSWDTAQQTLELYYKRNLAQVNLIFNLSVIVMVMGFLLITFGVGMTFFSSENKETLGIITCASGVITEFIGATFIFLYKSTISQSLEYTKKLDKLTSVGVAIKILDTINTENSYDPKSIIDSKIEIAKKLLDMNQS